MSSSSDIEKLFNHFGGDAGAYQEIGRENEARSARTRWPLLVTLDLTQPEIPAIGPRRGVAAQAPADDASQQAADRQDTAPKDTASVTRARAPLFTRPHRRDIPPVAAVVQPAGPRGAARFGVLETKDGGSAQAEPAAARIDAAAAQSARGPVADTAAPAAVTADQVTSVAVAPVQAAPAAAPPARVASAAIAPAQVGSAAIAPGHVATAASIPPIPPAAPLTRVPPAVQFRAPAMPAMPVIAPAPPAMPPQAGMPAMPPRTRTPAAPGSAPAPSWWARAPLPAPAASAAKPASILGKLFAPEPGPAALQAQAAAAGSAPLRSVFDRLRGGAAQPAGVPAPAPASAAHPAAPAASNSWLVNGPRHS
ncbi:cellulose biosynthesis protein BcsP [Paraburkholderia lacunae]|uniref:Cellulose biosynthesis protein BcsR n=1 Tax=Paraburkholderia lacunae TaxID=2211104 RepID=A0A370N5V7_9BURK|nr:cellulose biosynthesis protein BcsP [Paraburkholderia lacunae]RDK00972.1 hypothetical protein DLM46_19295 [Paraburkholderia lacunae]